MLFQAVKTSIFVSLLIVLGNAAPSPQDTVGALAAKGEGPPVEISSSRILKRAWAFSRPNVTLSREDLLACGAANGGEKDEVCEVPNLKGVMIS